MSSFEKAPLEIRNMIYELCLLHDGEINPYPTHYERIEIESKGGVPAKMLTSDSLNLLPKASVKYSKRWPSVALLGVNKAIQHEAATILFGRNVWRISDTGTYEDDNVWAKYCSYFRRVITSFDMRDVTPQQLMYITNRVSAFRIEKGKKIEVYDGRDTVLSTHLYRIESMRQIWIVKQDFLVGMHLDSLVFNIRNLFCPSGCCRFSIIKHLCERLGTAGPRSRLGKNSGRSLSSPIIFGTPAILGAEALTMTYIKIVGLRAPEEGQLFQNLWGLNPEHLSES